MTKELNAAEGYWLSNKIWIIIIVTIISFFLLGMNKYWELKASDLIIQQKHELLKQSVELKLDAILEKLKELKLKKLCLVFEPE